MDPWADIAHLSRDEIRTLQTRKLRHFISRNLYPFSPYYQKLFDSKGINDQFWAYLSYDEPELGFMTGNANVLFGDNSVGTKDHAWLLNNRKRIAGKTTE